MVILMVLTTTTRPVVARQKFDRYLSRLFHERADSNKDGLISFDECYENLLIFSTYLNRIAPIPPPRRDRLAQFYELADWNQTKGLQEVEFKLLAGILAARVSLRILLYKLVTWIGAPVLSAAMMQGLESTEFVTNIKAWANHMFFLPEAVTRRSFWSALFLVMNVSYLGMIVLWILDWALDRYKPFAKAWLPEKMPPLQNTVPGLSLKKIKRTCNGRLYTILRIRHIIFHGSERGSQAVTSGNSYC